MKDSDFSESENAFKNPVKQLDEKNTEKIDEIQQFTSEQKNQVRYN